MLVAGFCDNKSEYIPDAFYDILPISCNEKNCGFPMVMSETLNNLQCSNPYCPQKTAWRMSKLLSSIGITNISENILKEYIVENNIHNVFSIYSYDYYKKGLLHENLTDKTCINLTVALRNNCNFTLIDYVKAANLPYLQDSIDIIFDKVSDLKDFYYNLSKEGYTYMCNLLDLTNTKEKIVSIRVLKIIDIFNTYKEELLDGLTMVSIN